MLLELRKQRMWLNLLFGLPLFFIFLYSMIIPQMGILFLICAPLFIIYGIVNFVISNVAEKRKTVFLIGVTAVATIFGAFLIGLSRDEILFSGQRKIYYLLSSEGRMNYVLRYVIPTAVFGVLLAYLKFGKNNWKLLARYGVVLAIWLYIFPHFPPIFWFIFGDNIFGW